VSDVLASRPTDPCVYLSGVEADTAARRPIMLLAAFGLLIEMLRETEHLKQSDYTLAN
jgi:hypothetical protein